MRLADSAAGQFLILFFKKQNFEFTIVWFGIDLLDGSINTGLLYEDGTLPPNVRAWTGTSKDGTSSSAQCNDWKLNVIAEGRFGRVLDPANWGSDGAAGCDNSLNFICISNYMVCCFFFLF